MIANFYPRPPRGGRRTAKHSSCYCKKYFYPRPPRGGRLLLAGTLHSDRKFLSTPSARRATPAIRLVGAYARKFLSTPSARRATAATAAREISNEFLSTPSARRATAALPSAECLENISIHALREEGDARRDGKPDPRNNFYPRPPRGGRPLDNGFVSAAELFLSTPSARRATKGAQLLRARRLYFYPRPPRGGRRHAGLLFGGGGGFLSTPSARRATQGRCPDCQPLEFLSTPSARRATYSHRAERRVRGYFYPRPPRGGRPGQIIHTVDVADISIHALREEGDRTTGKYIMFKKYFYPRPPRGGRRAGRAPARSAFLFLSTPSARRATWLTPSSTTRPCNFYPRPPRGGRHTTRRRPPTS